MIDFSSVENLLFHGLHGERVAEIQYLEEVEK